MDVPEDITVDRGRRRHSPSPGPTTSAAPRAARPDALAGRQHGPRRVRRLQPSELEIVGVGYRAAAQGPYKIELQVGYSHRCPSTRPDGITFEVPAPNRIMVRGIDKQLVGQVAADIRKIRKPEPYKGKGIRYADERVLRKAGKSAK